MSRNLRLPKAEVVDDLTDRPWTCSKQLDDAKPIRLGHRRHLSLYRVVHLASMHQTVYTHNYMFGRAF